MTARTRDERGAAITDFAMVTALLLLVFIAVLQTGLALWVRNTLISAAQEGARTGARADAVLGEGAARTRDVIQAQLPDSYAQNISVSTLAVGGVQVVQVQVVAPFPVMGPFGPDRALTVQGRAYAEGQ